MSALTAAFKELVAKSKRTTVVSGGLMKKTLVLGALAAAWLVLVGAGGNAGPDDFRQVRVKLNAETGCWQYLGDATVFTGKFKAGLYLGVQMVTIGQDGFPEAPDQEERSPSLDAPGLPNAAAHRSWYGPLPTSKEYSLMFSPRASFGTTALVTVCGRTTPPH